MDEARKNHCWECRRRSLVCDFGVPGCKRCATSGVDCPGYGKTPPLRVRWLAPGQINARTVKHAQSDGKDGRRGASSVPSRDSPTPSEETRKLVIPHYEMKTEAHAQAESLEYFNTCIFPIQAQVLSLGTNVNVYKIPLPMFQMGLRAPDHIRLGLICSTLSHRMSQTVNDPSSKALAKTFYYYRGLMIRSLNEDLGVVKKRTSDMALAGILTLLFADTQQGISQSWRFHIEAVRRLLVVRGGMHSVAVSHGVLPMILCFVSLAVTADTSSPASDLLVETLPIEELCLLLGEYGGNGYAFQMCPPALFVQIAKINHLRARASKADIIGDLDLQEEACQILRCVYDFSPVEWTKANGPLEEAKILFFNIQQKAVALYCISSLQNLGLFTRDSPLSNSRYTERELLYGLLSNAFGPLSSLGLKGYLLWPTMVLGVEAVDGGAVMRFFVQKSLIDLSVSRGTYSPLAAKEVLESFWASGKTGWDACFDQPYMFTTVLTVNRGQMVK